MSLEDLRAAIEKTAFVRSSNDVTIIQAGGTNAPGEWLFDFRALILQPKWLNRYAEIFWEKYSKDYPFQVGGMETAGVPLVAAIVMKGVERGTPVNGFFIRKSRKKEGLLKNVEGTLDQHPIILVDDLINSGNTLNKIIGVLREGAPKVRSYFSILAFRDRDVYAALEKSHSLSIEHLFTLRDFNLPFVDTTTAPTPVDPAYTIKWKFSAKKPSFHLVLQKSTPALDDTRIFFGTDCGIFYALDQETGETLWSFEVGLHPHGKGILSSPAISGDNIYFGAYDGNVYALHKNTGEEAWVYFEADWVGSSPCVAEDIGLLFIGLEFGLWRKRGGIAALDLKTGKRRWMFSEMPCFTHASPLYIRQHEQVAIGSNDGTLYLFDARKGDLMWKYSLAPLTKDEINSGFSRFDIKGAPVYDHGRDMIIFGTTDGDIVGIDRLTGKPLHSYKASAGIWSTPILYKNAVLVSSLDKHLYCLSLDTFEQKWSWDAGARIFASPMRIDNRVYIGSNSGKMVELDAASGNEISSAIFSERITNPILHNADKGLFFIATQANEVYCVKRV